MENRKFGRSYLLKIEPTDGGEEIEIAPPYTIDINIQRNYLGSANAAQIRIYNLSEKTRARIRKNYNDTGLKKRILLFAGYGNTLSVVMSGYLTLAYSVREGTNYITTIECFDGGDAYAKAHIETEFPAGTTQREMIIKLIKSMDKNGVSIGAIGDFTQTSQRQTIVSGKTIDILSEITGNSFFIDNGKAYALRDNEAVAGEATVVSSSTGLLGTPVRQHTNITFSMLFEPRLAIGHTVKLESVTGESFNREFKVSSIKHSGTISESNLGSPLITEVGVFGSGFFSRISP